MFLLLVLSSLLGPPALPPSSSVPSGPSSPTWTSVSSRTQVVSMRWMTCGAQRGTLPRLRMRRVVRSELVAGWKVREMTSDERMCLP